MVFFNWSTVTQIIICLYVIGGTLLVMPAGTFSQSVESEKSYGYLSVNIHGLDSVYLVINDNFDSVLNIAPEDTLALETGAAKLRFIKKYYRDLVTTINIEKGETTRFGIHMLPVDGRKRMSRWSSYPRLFWEANHFLLSDPETDLFVDGEFAGRHFARIEATGKFEVKGVHASGKTFTKRYHSSDEAPFHFHQKHVQPAARTARTLSFVPGASQLYKNQTLKAVALVAVTLGGASLVYSYESRYQNSLDRFHELDLQYRTTRNARRALLLGNEAEDAWNKSVRLSKTRDRLIYATALVYLINIVDGFIAPSIGFRDVNRDIDPFLDFDPVYRQPFIGIKTSF